MESNYKPSGYPSVSAYLIVSDAAATIDFLCRVFDAREIRRFDSEQGGIMHAEVRLDDSVLMIADDPSGGSGVPAHVHIYVEDVDAVYERAVKADAESVQAPMQKEDEDRRAGVRQASGTTWWIATRVGAALV